MTDSLLLRDPTMFLYYNKRTPEFTSSPLIIFITVGPLTQTIYTMGTMMVYSVRTDFQYGIFQGPIEYGIIFKTLEKALESHNNNEPWGPQITGAGNGMVLVWFHACMAHRFSLQDFRSFDKTSTSKKTSCFKF